MEQDLHKEAEQLFDDHAKTAANRAKYLQQEILDPWSE